MPTYRDFTAYRHFCNLSDYAFSIGGGDPRSILYAKKELFKMRHGYISPFSAFLVFVFKVSGEVIITSVE